MDDVYGGGSVLSFTKVPCTPVTGAFANYFDVFGDVDQQRIGTGSSIASSTSSTSSCGGGDGDELPMLLGKNSALASPTASSSASASQSRILKINSAASSSLLSSSPYLCKSCNKRLVGSINNNSTKNSGRSNNARRNDSFDVTSVIQRDPYIVFLQEKQVEILGALHQEIRMLKHENSELKFQIHVILQQDDSDIAAERLCAYREKANCSDSGDNIDTSGMTMTVCGGDREKMLELELESATKMIQELKWVQQHYENKIRMQETKMDDLMRQLNISGNEDNANLTKAWPIQLQQAVPMYQTTKATNTTNRPLKSGRQRSSSVNPPLETVNRRNSLQSLLPDDYKEQVATLPPILAKQLGNPTSSLRNPNTQLNSSSPANNSKHYDNIIPKASRRSSLINSSTAASLARNNNNINTPTAFCGEEPSHCND